MRLYLAVGFTVAGLALPSAAVAGADKPVIAPAPAWIQSVSLPPTSKTDEAAVRVLLHDEQVLFEPGRRTVYSQIALRLQTPQGLAAGNISVPWRPDSDVLTVHKLLIRRGDKVIDVLASGQTFTVVRREANLESAALDGVLTANIQPEGLEVGDVIDFAASVSSTSPIAGARMEYAGGAWNGAPVDRAHLRLQWPAKMPVRLHTTGALSALRPVTRDDTSSAEIMMDGLSPVAPPKGAPTRFAIGRLAEATGYASWAQLAATMAPLYDKATALPPQGPLQAELLRIRALSNDPRVRAEAALALVQDRVRYVFLGMDGGNLLPADAATTWSRRFGDCKGKTALLLGLLHGLGIKAEAVLVNTAIGDGVNERLPMVGLFNHVLVRATVGGRTYWMDGTRTGDKTLDNLQTPAFGWGLPLVAQDSALVRVMPPPLDRPTQDVTIRMDATAGLTVPAPTRVEMLSRGDEALAWNAGLSNMTSDARDQAMREYWKTQYDFIDARKVTASFDAARSEHRLVMEGLARMDWNDGWYQTDGTSVGYKADFNREPGPGSDAPFAVGYPYHVRTTQTILLPLGGRGFTISDKPDVDQTVAGIQYRRTARIVGNVATIEKTERAIAPEFTASEASDAQTALRALADRLVHLRRPNGYRWTPQEAKIALAATPTTASGFIDQGNVLLDDEQYDKAFAAFDRAVALDPKNGSALVHRGLTRVWQDDLDAAAKDLDAAAVLNPGHPVLYRARGLLAEQRNDAPGAVAAYTRSLEIDPDSAFAFGRRAEAHRAARNTDAALADAAAAIEKNPTWHGMYLLRANLLRNGGRRAEASAEAEALMKADPDSVEAHVTAARIFAALDQRAKAMRAFDRAMAIRPDSLTLINRAVVRAPEDVAGRRLDLEAAVKLDPGTTSAWVLLAKLDEEGGNETAALKSWNRAIAAQPDHGGPLAGRGLLHARAGRAGEADKDLAAARALATGPEALNELCWDKATAGLMLASALTDCNAALAKMPDAPAYLDSRGLVYLRLGRLDEAMADYDRALGKAPRQASSLYGRSVVWARKINKAKSDADAAAALAIDPDVERDYAKYKIRR